MQAQTQQTRTIYSAEVESLGQDSAGMAKMIAENIFRDLKSYGLQDKDIVAVSSELLNKLTVDIRSRSNQSAMRS